MSQTQQSEKCVVTLEEIARRIAEYRRLGWEHRSPVMMVYPPSQQKCPWADCNQRVSGFRIELGQLGDDEARERWMEAWWKGSGLVARCPKCGRYVLFGYEVKHAVLDPRLHQQAILPDNWTEHSDLTPKLAAQS